MRYISIFYLLVVILACEDTTVSIKPKRTNITESVYASVRILPANMYRPFTNRPGIIKALYIQEGDDVQKGQVLLKIAAPNQQNQSATAQLKLEQAQQDYQGASSSLKSLATEIQRIEKTLNEDSINFERQRRLWEQQIGAEIQFEAAKTKFDLTKISLQKAQDQYKQTEAQLKNNIALARLALQNESIVEEEYSIQADRDGLVYALYKESGEMLGSQEPVAMIGSRDSFYLDMDIDEVDVVKITIGDTVLITLDAYPEKVFKAKVVTIAPLKNESKQTFTVEGVFLERPPVLFAGMAGEANIIIDTRKNALIIPIDYLLPNDKVLTAQGEVAVRTGIRSLEFVEITSGIDTATVLLKNEEE